MARFRVRSTAVQKTCTDGGENDTSPSGGVINLNALNLRWDIKSPQRLFIQQQPMMTAETSYANQENLK